MESNNQMVTVLGTVHAPDYAKQAVYSYAGTTKPAGGVTGWHTFGREQDGVGHHLYVDGHAFYTLHKSDLKTGQTWPMTRPSTSS